MYDDKSPADCHALRSEGWTYLDVRTPDEFEGGHPEGAINIPFALIGPGGMMPNPLFLSETQKLFPAETALLVGCASGGRSSRACQMLAQVGFGNLVNVVGGYSGARDASGGVVAAGWCDCGLPSVAGADDGSYSAVQKRIRG